MDNNSSFIPKQRFQESEEEYFDRLNKIKERGDYLQMRIDDIGEPVTSHKKRLLHNYQQLLRNEVEEPLRREAENGDIARYSQWYQSHSQPHNGRAVELPTETPKKTESEMPSPIRDTIRLAGPILRGGVKGLETLGQLGMEGAQYLGIPGMQERRERLHAASERLQNDISPAPNSLIGQVVEGGSSVLMPLFPLGVMKGVGAAKGLLSKLFSREGAAAGVGGAEATRLAGLLEHNPPLVTPVPPKRLTGPESSAPKIDDYSESMLDDMMNRATRPAERPPNVRGVKEDVLTPEQRALYEIEESRKLSPPYPADMGRVLKEAGEGEPLLLKRAKGKAKKGEALASGPEAQGSIQGAASKLAEQVKLEAGLASNNPTLMKGVGEGLKDLKDKVLSKGQTPDFALRKSETGQQLSEALYEAERGTSEIINQFYFSFNPQKGLLPTGLRLYHEAPKSISNAVDRLMVEAERVGSLDLAANKLKAAPEVLEMAKGIRLQDDRLYTEMHKAYGALKKEGLDPDFKPPGYLPEHIPHRWLGRYEIYVNGEKFLKSDGTSGFARPGELLKQVDRLAGENPKANIFVKDWASENVKRARGFTSLRKREGAPGYQVEDLKKVWDDYFYEGSRFLSLARAKLAANDLIKKGKDLRPQDIEYAKNRLDLMAGRPVWDEAFVEKSLKQTGLDKYIDPRFASRGLPLKARQVVTALKLGFGNVSYALFNTFSIVQNVYPALARTTPSAEKYLLEGIKGLGNPRLREYLVHKGVIDVQMLEKTPGFNEPGAMNIVMTLGRKTEEWTRTVAAVAQYQAAKAMGMAERDALASAHNFAAETMGLYSKAGKPEIFQGIVGGLGGQFKTYMIVMLQNLVRSFEHSPGAAARYLATNVGLAGLWGTVPESDKLDGFITEHFGFSPKQVLRETMVKHFGSLGEAPLTGLTSALPEPYAMDWTKRIGINDLVPQAWQDWLGPGMSTLVNVLSDVRDGDTRRLIADLAPQPFSNFFRVDGENAMGRRERVNIRLSPEEAAIKRAGFGPKREARTWEELRTQDLKSQYLTEKAKRATDLVVGNPLDWQALEEAQRVGVTGRQVMEEIRRKQQDVLQRQEPRLRKKVRQDKALR